MLWHRFGAALSDGTATGLRIAALALSGGGPHLRCAEAQIQELIAEKRKVFANNDEARSHRAPRVGGASMQPPAPHHLTGDLRKVGGFAPERRRVRSSQDKPGPMWGRGCGCPLVRYTQVIAAVMAASPESVLGAWLRLGAGTAKTLARRLGRSLGLLALAALLFWGSRSRLLTKLLRGK